MKIMGSWMHYNNYCVPVSEICVCVYIGHGMRRMLGNCRFFGMFISFKYINNINVYHKRSEMHKKREVYTI